MELPPLPPALKIISPYMKLAKEYDKREPVVAYYCRLYCIQKAIATDSKSPDCKKFLLTLMDALEKAKKDLAGQGMEAVSNELVGQAHMEANALNLFTWADQEDRNSNFNKGLVKAFYSANLLFDVLKQFGELSEEVILKQRYAKWKATYIHKCLQTGETPVPGPQGSEFEGAEFSSEFTEQTTGYQQQQNMPHPMDWSQPNVPNQTPYPAPNTSYTHTPPKEEPKSSYSSHEDESSAAIAASGSSSHLGPQEYQQATKFCKYAVSSLQYEDVSTAIENLTKALNLLKGGK
ncbi:vacuolar protein sorting-associated protein VTA1 homolog [Rhopilema esculentum]|uniref:vacuolar protein sorting-associated protein VTA1 homolog n=1 Tax=Rhopilema esculentum TaxID=499914 RepID=UPI0031D26FAB|eukprot:gene17322-8900_t